MNHESNVFNLQFLVFVSATWDKHRIQDINNGHHERCVEYLCSFAPFDNNAQHQICCTHHARMLDPKTVLQHNQMTLDPIDENLMSRQPFYVIRT